MKVVSKKVKEDLCGVLGVLIGIMIITIYELLK